MLEAIIVEENKGRDDKINKTKVKVFCETRWIQRHVVLEEVQLLYEPILKTLEKISSEKRWDCKTMDQAHGLTKNLTKSTFLVALRVCAYTLGFKKPLSAMLQGTCMDVIDGYKHIVKEQLKTLCKNCDKTFIDEVWRSCQILVATAEIDLIPPRRCGR